MAEDSLSWRTLKPGLIVADRDGATIGTVGRVLADEGADIFHGIALRHGPAGLGREREILAARIERITEVAVHTSLSGDEVHDLPAMP